MRFLARIITVGVSLLVTAEAKAAPMQTPHVEAELIAEHAALNPGAESTVALRLKPEPGWHTYWLNAGDAGYATTLDWKLPPGFRAGPIQWPAPERHRLGELTTYGYGRETLHVVNLSVPADAKSPVTLQAKAKWLVCSDEVCIPGEAQLSLTLPTADARWTEKFVEARSQLPREIPMIRGVFSLTDGALNLKISGYDPAADSRVEFFPEIGALVNHSAPQQIGHGGDGFVLQQKLSDYYAQAPTQVKGVLVDERNGRRQAFAITAVPGTTTVLPHAPVTETNLGLILGFALLGGLILNLMPCVFPVLSLKALALVEAREASRADNRAQALAYTAGVVISCALAAAALLGLRAGGEAVGWGFQLQSPVFVALLVYVLFALGLALSGVFEFGAGLMNLGDGLTRSRGLAGSFFAGVLALVVASPCTAPFMGTALGFALTQSAPTALLIFCTLGLGLALPFLLLGFFPRLAGFLPQPGAWMLSFRKWMAFPLYLSAVWLLWVLMRQAGADAAALALIGLVLIAFALTVKQRVLKAIALAAALAMLALTPQKTAIKTDSAQVWSEARVAELRGQNRTIFVDFTADWCLTCKVNERVALHTDAVQAAFRDKNVAFLVADWTNPDAAIARKLAEFGQPGVPMYLVYVKGGEPKQLPQVLTPELVINSLEK